MDEAYREWEKIYACWLCNFPDMGSAKRYSLTQLCGGAQATYFSDKKMWRQVLTQKQVDSLANFTQRWKPKEEYHRMISRNIRLINEWDTEYPKALRQMPDKPYGLFVKGVLPGDEIPKVAVIGARDCSEYGKYIAGKIGETLGRNGIPVISGMARGIDGIVQEAALDSGGTSVAVLGSGVDICYPAQNRRIYDRLERSGAIVSEYPLGMRALSMNFPIRNRIVSGLADVVVVVEAGTKSGTLITVDMALEQGKEVYVVPGRITDRLAEGCNRLVKQGAEIFVSCDDFLDELWEMWNRKNQNTSADSTTVPKKQTETQAVLDMREKLQMAELSPEQISIYKILDDTPKTVDEITELLPMEYKSLQITTHLMWLCMRNMAIQVTSGHFCRKRN